jgi:dihydroxyacid dehydratase/phosphogluconate dehydratase
MAIVVETLGIAALGSGSVPANDPGKAAVARTVGAYAVSLVESGVRPRDIIIDRSAFDFGPLETAVDTEHYLLADMARPELSLKG